MKKLIATFCLTVMGLAGYSQSCFWHENMEVIDSVTSTPAGIWSQNTRIANSGIACDSAAVQTGTTSYLQTGTLDFTGQFFVTLSFYHIARIDFFDAASVEVSSDGGATWVPLTCQEFDSTLVDGPAFCGQSNVFSSATTLDWDPGNPATVPNNTMWHLARFDMSQILQNSPNAIVRFKLEDRNGGGSGGYQGWFIDDVCINAANCELNPPLISLFGPNPGGTVYNLGPFDVTTSILDASGVQSATLSYTINGIAQPDETMFFIGGNEYTGTLPAVNDGDTICYAITAIDNSGCSNVTSYPVSGCVSFIASTGITFPYCDNFDINQLWVDTTLTGSSWQLGQPTTWPGSANSAPSCWEVDIDQQYQPNTEAYLYSPVFSFSGTYNAKIEFSLNVNTEFNWDGTRLEYSTDLGNTWNILGTNTELPPNAVNWYNDDALLASGTFGWMGTSSDVTNGAFTDWFKASHNLSMLDNAPDVRFRFTFDSDGAVQDEGIAIDDLCIIKPPDFDAGVISISQPTNQAPEGLCVDVIVTIQNYGGQALTSIPITYSDGLGNTGTTTWTGNLAPGASVTDTITPCFTIPAGLFNLTAYTSLANDGNLSNDTSSINGVGIPVLTPTSCDDFENGNIGWLSTPVGGGNEWQQGAPAFGATTGAHSGANAWDINLGSGYVTGEEDTLFSPIYNVTGLNNSNLSVSFWRNQAITPQNDGLWLEYTLDGGVSWITLGNTNSNATFEAQNWYNQQNINFSNQQGFDGNSNGWIKSTYFLNNLLNILPAPTNVRFRFIFQSDQFGFGGDGVSIDDFCVTIPCANDLGLFTAQSVNTANGITMPEGSQDSIQVTIHNFGTDPQSNFTVSYTINGTAFGPFPYTGAAIPPNGTLTIILPNTYTVPASQYNIAGWVNLTGDCEAANDTAVSTGVGVPTIAIDFQNSYCDDFENGNIGWTPSIGAGGDPGSVWELGTPNFGLTNSAHSGVNAWDINLNTQYTNNANAILTSPIFDLTNAVDTRVEFWQNVESETGWDGTRLQYTIDGGLNWATVGISCDTSNGTVNWYNDPALNSSDSLGWTSGTVFGGCTLPTGWFKSIQALPADCNNQPAVQLRFIFTSDPSVLRDGYSIDDFCLIVPVPLTATPISISNANNVPLIFPGQPITFNTRILNDGTTALNNLQAWVWVDNNTPFSQDAIIFGNSLTPNAFYNHTFANTWIATPGIHTVCAATYDPNQSLDLKPNGDTTCFTIQVFDSAVINSTQRCYDFESGAQWVALNSVNYGPNQSWTLGGAGKLGGPYNGSNSWFTSLLPQYENRDTSSLFSPLFVVNGGLTYNLNFLTSFKTERNEDGGTVEYSLDYGNTWKQLGNSQDPNWMNTYSITALGSVPPVRAGWSGNSSGWTPVNHDLCIPIQGTQNIVFRWRFNSDFSIQDEGWAIDQVCFELVQPLVTCVTGVEDLPNEFSLVQNSPNPFNDITTISFNLTEKGNTQLQIVDVTGKIVATPINAELSAGSYNVNVSAKELAGGIYFYTLTHNNSSVTKKMVVAK